MSLPLLQNTIMGELSFDTRGTYNLRSVEVDPVISRCILQCESTRRGEWGNTAVICRDNKKINKNENTASNEPSSSNNARPRGCGAGKQSCGAAGQLCGAVGQLCEAAGRSCGAAGQSCGATVRDCEAILRGNCSGQSCGTAGRSEPFRGT